MCVRLNESNYTSNMCFREHRTAIKLNLNHTKKQIETIFASVLACLLSGKQSASRVQSPDKAQRGNLSFVT